jgi:Na+/proline symporter
MQGIYELVLTASAFGTAGILVVTMMGMYSRWGRKEAAISAMIAGLILTPMATYVWRLQAPFLTSIAGSLAAFAGGAVLASRREAWSRLRPSILGAKEKR